MLYYIYERRLYTRITPKAGTAAKYKIEKLTLLMPHGTIKFYVIIHSHINYLIHTSTIRCRVCTKRQHFFVVHL